MKPRKYRHFPTYGFWMLADSELKGDLIAALCYLCGVADDDGRVHYNLETLRRVIGTNYEYCYQIFEYMEGRYFDVEQKEELHEGGAYFQKEGVLFLKPSGSVEKIPVLENEAVYSAPQKTYDELRQESGLPPVSRSASPARQDPGQAARPRPSAPESDVPLLEQGFDPLHVSAQDPKQVKQAYEFCLDVWNKACARFSTPQCRLSTVRSLSDQRKKKLRTRLEQDPHFCARFREACYQLPVDNNEKFHWQPNFDWMIRNDTNVLRLSEGAYRQQLRPVPPQHAVGVPDHVGA